MTGSPAASRRPMLLIAVGLIACALVQCTSAEWTCHCTPDELPREGTWVPRDQPWDDAVVESATFEDGVFTIRYTTRAGSRSYVARLAISEY